MTVPEARTTVQEQVLHREPQSQSMTREVGQSFYLMGLMAVMLTVYVGLGLLAAKLFG